MVTGIVVGEVEEVQHGRMNTDHRNDVIKCDGSNAPCTVKHLLCSDNYMCQNCNENRIAQMRLKFSSIHVQNSSRKYLPVHYLCTEQTYMCTCVHVYMLMSSTSSRHSGLHS